MYSACEEGRYNPFPSAFAAGKGLDSQRLKDICQVDGGSSLQGGSAGRLGLPRLYLLETKGVQTTGFLHLVVSFLLPREQQRPLLVCQGHVENYKGCDMLEKNH